MPWTLSPASHVVRRAGTIIGARVIFERPAEEATPQDPRTRIVQVHRRIFRATGDGASQTGAEFRAMLLGGGTVQDPRGEVGAWLAELNRAGDTEEHLS